MSQISIDYDIKKETLKDGTVKEYRQTKEVKGMKKVFGYTENVETPVKNVFNSFEKHKYLMNTDFLTSNRAYIFFTCPNMNLNPNDVNNTNLLDDKDRNNGFFLMVKNSVHLKKLYDYFNGRGMIYPLSNLAENFENSDTVLKTDKFYSTKYGEHMVTPQFYFDSTSGGEFTINYSEVASMYITVLHKIWVDYIQLVRQGYFTPKKECIANDVKTMGEVDYLGSVYYFLVGEDGETIKYWSKYTGVFPTNVPYSAFNFEQGGDVTRRKLSINYSYSFKRDMEEDIFYDFNHVFGNADLSGSQKNDRLASYNNWATTASVVKQEIDIEGFKETAYKLIWR